MRRTELLAYGLLSLVAIFAYLYGLDSLHLPKNGDEYVYAHITRVTAASGDLLPLRSELESMRNTKPPALFWQGILSTDWGSSWSFWRLRWPCAVYSLLTALLAGLMARKLTSRTELGFVAALVYLCFLGTFRYGRPFVTEAPITFWLSVPFAALYLGRPRSWESWSTPVVLGLAVGVGLLYKSVLLLGPVGIALAWWYLDARRYRLGEFARRDVAKLVVVALLGLGVFSLWFLLDPRPGDVWRDFILGENAGKFEGEGYLRNLLLGRESVWVLAFRAVAENPGLMLFPLLAVLVRPRRGAVEGERLFWIWFLVFFLVFCLPSKRSPRYLLPAMPAIAVLIAARWEHLPRWSLRLPAATAGLLVLALCLISYRLGALSSGAFAYPFWHWLVLGSGLAAGVAGAILPHRMPALAAVLLAYLGFGSSLSPLDGAPGHYDEEARRAAAGRVVYAPFNFPAKYERYAFLLPKAELHGYRDSSGATPPFEEFPLAVVQLYPRDLDDLGDVEVLGERWDLRTRQSSEELRAFFLEGDRDAVLVREVLVERR